MKKPWLIVPLLALMLVLAGCSKEPAPQDTPSADNNNTRPSDSVTPDDVEMPDEETDNEDNDTEDADVDAEAEEGTNPSESEDDDNGGMVTLPDLKVELPKLDIVNPNDDDDDDDDLPSIQPNLDIKVTLPVIDKINPPIPDPNPSL